jgi:hypothetical protein
MSANQIITECYNYAYPGANANVATFGGAVASYGYINGVFVSFAGSSPTITVYDDPAAGTTKKLIDTFTPVSGNFYHIPGKYNKGCRVVITGSITCTIFYNRP